MYGNLLYGGTQYGDNIFGADSSEYEADFSRAQSGIYLKGQAVLTTSPSAKERIPEDDVDIDLLSRADKNGFSFRAAGAFEEWGTTATAGLAFGVANNILFGEALTGGTHKLGLNLRAFFRVVNADANTIAWSKIGHFDFTQDHTNIAGDRVMSWKGAVLGIYQLQDSNKIIVYGENGISMISPKEVYYTEKVLASQGALNKSAIVDTPQGHFFIGQDAKFYQVTYDGLKLLDYNDWFDKDTAYVLSYDRLNNVIHISSDAFGDNFIYSISHNSLFRNYDMVTGTAVFANETQLLGYHDDQYSYITFGPFDFKTHKAKTIYSVDVFSDNPEDLQIQLTSYIAGKKEPTVGPVKQLDKNGHVQYGMYGELITLKIIFKKSDSATYDVPVSIKNVKINGAINNYAGEL